MAFEDFTNWYKNTNWWRSGGAKVTAADVDARAKAAGMKTATDWVATGIVSAPFVHTYLKNQGLTGYADQREAYGLTADQWKAMSMADKQSNYATLRASQQRLIENPNALTPDQAEYIMNSLGNAQRLADFNTRTNTPADAQFYDADFSKWQKENLPYQSLTSGMINMTGNLLGNIPYKGDVVQQWFNNGKGLSWEDMAKSLTTEGIKSYALAAVGNAALGAAGAGADAAGGKGDAPPADTGGFNIGNLSGTDILTLMAVGGSFGGGDGIPGPGIPPTPTVVAAPPTPANLASDPANLTALPDLSRKALAGRGRRGRAGTILAGDTLGGGSTQQKTLLGA